VPSALRRVLVAAGLLVLALVPSAILTILLMPLWSWIEARFQIESVGHSGPAGWCYIATYAAVVAVLLLAWGILARRAPPGAQYGAP
jgi:hypothetical protein